MHPWIHTSLGRFTHILHQSCMRTLVTTWTSWILITYSTTIYSLFISVQFATRKGILWRCLAAFPLRSPQRHGQSWHSCPQHWMASRLRSNRQNPASDATALLNVLETSRDIVWLGSAMPMYWCMRMRSTIGLLMSPCLQHLINGRWEDSKEQSWFQILADDSRSFDKPKGHR